MPAGNLNSPPYSTARPSDALFDRPVPIRSDGRRFQLYEYVFYALIVYPMWSGFLGISVGSVLGAMRVALAMLCILRVRSQIFSIQATVLIPLLSAVSFVSVQLFVHSESLMDPGIRSMLIWGVDLIIVKSLCTRPGFLRRASTILFISGLMLLPFMSFRGGRAELDHYAGVALTNSNDLALWFGFCALAFTIRGFETPRGFRRWISWTAAILSAVVLALTVSRGPLIALVVCIIIVLRKQLKRGFLPILLVAALAVAAMASGVLDGAIQKYAERGTEDTGRFVVWPRVLARMWESPAAGVGVSRLFTPLDNGFMIPPHNGFLFIGLASGAVPLLFFCLYWLIGLRGAVEGSSPLNPDSAYLLPLFVYAFMALFEDDGAFLATWSIISVCACLPHSGFRHRREIRSGSKKQLKDGKEFEFVVSQL